MGLGHSHDHADHLDSALADSAAGIRAVKISLVALAATAAAQLVIVAVSGSVALFADTVPITHLGWVAAAGIVGFVGNELVAVYRIRVGTTIGSAALRADGLHARVDGLTSLAVVAGAAGVAAGYPAADPIVGLVIAAVILGVLAVAVRDVFRRLLDGVDPRLIDTAYEVLAQQDGVDSVRRVRMRWLGHRLVADAELDIDPHRSLQQAHRIAHDAEHALTHGVPKLAEATIHAYPAHSAGVVSS